jgi:hypothetical protein
MSFVSDLFGGDDNEQANQGLNDSARISAETGRRMADWFTAEADRTRGQRDQQAARADQVAGAQLEAMQFATQEARDLAQRRRTVAQPLEDQIISDAKGYDTPERRTAAAEAAVADVDRGFSATQAATNRSLARSGVAPGGAKSMAMMQDVALEGAKARAGAATNAVRNVEQQGYARRMDAAGLTKGVVSNQATMQSLAQNAGMGAVQAGAAGINANMAGADLMRTGFSGAMQGNQIAGNLYGQSAQISSGGAADMMGGIGGLMQGIGAIWGKSSKESKTEKAPVSDEAVLEATKKLPVETWRYKEGQGDGGEHVGPYAEDVQRQFGDRVAPKGGMVDLVAMNRNNAKAIAALTKQVEQVEAELAQLAEVA